MAATLDGYNGARSIALGNAYVGLADDGYSIFSNPAGLAQVNSFSIVSMYSQPDTGISFSSVGTLFPRTPWGNLGIAYRRLSLTGFQASTETVDYADQEIIVALAGRYGDRLSAALSLHYFLRGLSRSVSGFDGVNGSGTAVDLGLKYDQFSWLKLGLALQDYSGVISYGDGTRTRLDPNLVLGSSGRIIGPGALFSREAQELTANLDLSQSNGQPPLFRTGVEWWPLPFLAARCGLEQSLAEIQGTTNQLTTFNNWTAGIGLKFPGVTFDYALYRYGDSTGDQTHYFSLSYSELPDDSADWRVTTPESAAVASVESAVKRIPRKHFSDVPGRHYAREAIEVLATAGIMDGFPDGKYYPEQKLTRGEFDAIISIARNTMPAFVSDPSAPQTRAEAARLLGSTERLLRPKATITRAETAVLIYNTYWARAQIKRFPPIGD
jgi:hypothetical protein